MWIGLVGSGGGGEEREPEAQEAAVSVDAFQGCAMARPQGSSLRARARGKHMAEQPRPACWDLPQKSPRPHAGTLPPCPTGHPSGLLGLAIMHLQGRGVPQSYERAKRAFQQALEIGSMTGGHWTGQAEAHFYLGEAGQVQGLV